ncbi:hypothetical protein VNO78_21920 [Psophocarpus tetragonolobus]|uniref:Uncharacterized protein n=1 Tax=Psophocarpus tetragonolobus TaxID=3891 RepID=A0AAN9XI04_PSOTE
MNCETKRTGFVDQRSPAGDGIQKHPPLSLSLSRICSIHLLSLVLIPIRWDLKIDDKYSGLGINNKNQVEWYFAGEHYHEGRCRV